MPSRKKVQASRRLLFQVEEDRADYALAIKILQRNEPTYTLGEVIQDLGMDKYHLKFRTRRLQKKHRLEFDAT
jgi:AraC-like DNA-binding protein